MLREVGRREMTAVGEALEMLGARVDSERVQAVPVRRGMESISFGTQVFVRSRLALRGLDAPECVDYRPVCFATPRQSGDAMVVALVGVPLIFVQISGSAHLSLARVFLVALHKLRFESNTC